MLTYFPEKRACAAQMLMHYWLSIESRGDYIMTKKESDIYLNLLRDSNKNSSFYMNYEAEDSENFDADVDDNRELAARKNSEEEEQGNSFSEDFDDSQVFYDGHNLVDRSFRNVYSGYKNGINIETLDSESTRDQVLERCKRKQNTQKLN